MKHKGKKHSEDERLKIIAGMQEELSKGAELEVAAGQFGICGATYRRWLKVDGGGKTKRAHKIRAVDLNEIAVAPHVAKRDLRVVILEGDSSAIGEAISQFLGR